VARVVIDPGVFVSALVAPKGTPAQLVDLLLEQRFELVTSPRLLAELTGVLLRDRFRRYVTAAEVRELIADLAAVAIVIPDPPDPAAVTRDPNDDYLVALAVAAGADALISGDRDLTDLADQPVPVLTPRAFIDRLDEEAPSSG
jgi:putative PIN family toxin of toxin-antitoxin system